MKEFLDRRYVEKWLRERSMRKYELAWKAEITGAALSQLINGHVKPHSSTVKRLAEAMEVDPAEIVISPEDVPPEVNRNYKRIQSARRKYRKEKQHGKKKNSQRRQRLQGSLDPGEVLVRREFDQHGDADAG